MKIIKLGILAHVDAGKTTLTESFIVYQWVQLQNEGSVDQGTTRTYIRIWSVKGNHYPDSSGIFSGVGCSQHHKIRQAIWIFRRSKTVLYLY